MDASSRRRRPKKTSSQLYSCCQSLIRLALKLWRYAIISTAKEFLVIMRILVNIDEILRYACSLGKIDSVNLKSRVRLLELEIERGPYTMPGLKSSALHRLLTLLSLGDAKMSGLGRIATPACLVPLRDETNVPLYLHTDPRRGFRRRSPEELEEEVVLDAYRNQLSTQVGVLKRPIIQKKCFPKQLETYFQTLGLEYPTHILSHVHSTLATNPQVYILPTFKQNPELYCLINRGRGQDVIFKDRRGNLHFILDVCNWKSSYFPRRLYWTLYQLKVDKKEESDTPVELSLIKEQVVQNTPTEHFEILSDTWQRIIELEGKPKGDLCIGWLIEVNDFFAASPEASCYLRLANEKGLLALSKKLECTFYPAKLVSTIVSHSVLGIIYFSELGIIAGLQGYYVKDIRSIRIDYGQIDSPNGLYDNPATRILRRWCKYNHPNVLSLVGICEIPCKPCKGIGLMLPNTNMKSLSAYLDATPNVDRCKLCVEISSGLSYLHASGVMI